jgi:hypothetical protein
MARRLTDRGRAGKEARAVAERLPRRRTMARNLLGAPGFPRSSPMSCDVASAAFLMFAALTGPSDARLQNAALETPSLVASQPLFADIVSRAGKLKSQVEGYRSQVTGSGGVAPLPGQDAFAAEIAKLSAMDQQGSDWLKTHSSDGDLKCILHGISQDLPVKLQAVKDAKTAHDEDLALRDMMFLLRDNVEVITAPPRPAA